MSFLRWDGQVSSPMWHFAPCKACRLLLKVNASSQAGRPHFNASVLRRCLMQCMYRHPIAHAPLAAILVAGHMRRTCADASPFGAGLRARRRTRSKSTRRRTRARTETRTGRRSKSAARSASRRQRRRGTENEKGNEKGTGPETGKERGTGRKTGTGTEGTGCRPGTGGIALQTGGLGAVLASLMFGAEG